jgi:hypothetical protein
MSNKSLILTLAIVGSVLILVVLAKINLNSRQGVSVTPNESIITAEILEYHSPQLVTIQILSSKRARVDVEDFGKHFLGAKVMVNSQERISSDLVGKKIRAYFAKFGDERGHAYWIWKVEVMNH